MSQVVIIGGGLSGKHAAEILVRDKGLKVTVVQANSFVEWTLAMTYVLTQPDLHDQFLAPNLEAYRVKGVDYKFGIVTKVDVEAKQVVLSDGSRLAYEAVVVATGFDLPLISAQAGTTLAERKAEIRQAAAAIEAAETVIVAGGGPVGLELAGDIRVAHPSKKIKLLVRGKVLPQWPEQTRAIVMRGLAAMSIEVLQEAAPDAPTEPRLTPGTFALSAGGQVAYDIFLPAYSQGPNLKFLQGTPELLDARGRLVVNEFLQCKAHSQLFGIGVTDVDEAVMMPKLEGQWGSVCANVKLLLAGKPLKRHTEAAAAIKLPPVLLIGRGKTGWGHIDFGNLPAPLKLCCCGGLAGFPFCPCVCCWPCCTPCACGRCCGAPSGSGPAALSGKMLNKFPAFHFKGWGELESGAPKQQHM